MEKALKFEVSIPIVNDKIEKNCNIYQLGSVAGPVIQATGRLEFEDALWLSSPLYGLWAPSGCPQPNKKCGREWSNQSGSGPAAKNRTEIMPTMQTKFFLLNFQNNIGTFSLEPTQPFFDFWCFSAPLFAIVFINDMTVLHAFLLLVTNEMYWH